MNLSLKLKNMLYATMFDSDRGTVFMVSKAFSEQMNEHMNLEQTTSLISCYSNAMKQLNLYGNQLGLNIDYLKFNV